MRADVLYRAGDSVVVEVSGELDLSTAAELRSTLLELAGDRTHLVVDFAGVRFCDAVGLGALVAVGNRLREGGGSLRLTGVRAAQRKIMRITGLERLFEPREVAGG